MCPICLVCTRWDEGGTEPAGEYTFFYGNLNENHELRTVFLYIRE
jgi:hypothetical protein